jgi:Zn-dependent protease with chaperone function
MRTILRALHVIGLLLGFYLICAVIIGAFIVADVFAVELGAGRSAIFLFAGTVGAIVVVLRGVFVSTRIKRKDLPGLPVSHADQPVLWAHVTEMARAAGTRPPSEIRLIPNVNAAVMEHTHLLGLVPGKRRMLIGVPLMLALPVPLFDAVLAHELGHYSGRDARFGPLTARAREGVIAALMAVRGSSKKGKKRYRWPGSDVYAAVFAAYANLVLSSTFAASRRQELAADRFAASFAGRDNAAAALSELPVVDASYDFYLDRYVSAGLPLGLLPPPADILGGFGSMFHDAGRAEELGALRSAPREEQTHKWDSHPPVSERVAAILALPADGRSRAGGGTTAISLLMNPQVPLAALAVKMVGDKATGKRAADWQAQSAALGLAAAQKQSAFLADVVRLMIGRPSRVVDLLDLIDAGRMNEILDQFPRSEVARKINATGRTAREFAKTSATPMLRSWLVLELVTSGRAWFRHSWSTVSGELVAEPGLIQELQAGMDAVLASVPNTMKLRAALETRKPV